MTLIRRIADATLTSRTARLELESLVVEEPVDR
jgi:hypothetical protein